MLVAPPPRPDCFRADEEYGSSTFGSPVGNGTEQMINQKPSKLQDAILAPTGCETVPEMFLTFRLEITLEGWVLHQEPQIKDRTKPVELPLPLTHLRLAHIL